MTKKPRTFKQLQKSITFEEIKQKAKEVTEIYATSVTICSQEVIASEHGITVKCLRELMDYAIVTNLVSRQIADKVGKKTIKNQKNSGSAKKHSRKILRQREENLAAIYSTEQIKQIARDYVLRQEQPIIYFTQKYNLESDWLTRSIFQRAIVDNIVSDNMMKSMIQRSLRFDNSEYNQKYFEYLRKERIKKQKNSL